MCSGTGCDYWDNLDSVVPYCPHRHGRAASLSETPGNGRGLTLGICYLNGTRRFFFCVFIWLENGQEPSFGREVG